MIHYLVGYGLLLTTPEGEAFTMYEKVVERINEIIKEKSDYDIAWLVTMKLNKKSKNDQMILGMDVELNKNMDFNLIHEEWEKLMRFIPEDIKKLLKLYGQNEPDI